MQVICSIILLFLFVNILGQSDFSALLELKKGIVKDPSGELVSWDSMSLDSNGCPSNWFGIICSNGRVTSISLTSSGLVGDFNFAAIEDLAMLRNLSLSNNQFTGTILKIGLLKSLEFLDLSCNMFHGLVPDSLSSLNNLALLNLSSNEFRGTFPSALGKLDKMKYLDLRGNGFSGDIVSLLSQMGEEVVYIDLSSNRFTGSMDVGVDGRSSFISSIQYLNVSRNLLSGVLFPHDGMPYFDSLEVFDASDNQFVGIIPSFNFMVSLQILRLGSNKLSGSLPQALLQESSMLLSELDLSLNQLQGPVGRITSTTLKKLNISSNKFTGSLPTSVGQCSVIDLSNNLLSGNLSRIQSWGNYVEVIQLSSNSLTGTLPNKSSQFLRLTSLRISNNSLEGVLPTVLGTYPELKVIDLSHNRLSGPLLPSLFSSLKLTDLNLSGNNFTGPIQLHETMDATSSSLQSSSMVSLDLSYNSLTGGLPSELSKFNSLIYLNLSKNYFEGVIPDSLPDSLKSFDVSFNNLSGAIPGNLLRFSDSAFHPGNSLLIFPSTSSRKGFPGLTATRHRFHMKPAIKIGLIASLIGVAALVVLSCIVVYYRAKRLEHSSNSSIKDRNKGAVEEGSSVISQPETNKNKKASIPPSGFNQDKGESRDSGDTLSVSNKDRDVGYHESLGKEEETCSPMSLMSSSNPSPSKNQQFPENPQALRVRSPEKLAGDLHLFDGSLSFTAEELSRAPAEVIAKSCHGTLYKATLDSGHVLAVKWLREGMAKGKKEFSREVKKLGSIKHPNLISVNGFYWGPKDHEKLLISTFINAQSLAFYLQGTERREISPLSIQERLKVAVDIAGCLSYFHNEKTIPHGNLKSSNILLETSNKNVWLTDYSLHRILTPAGTAEQVLNAGALGYRPPEFASSSKPCPSLKSDVYAFGVILLELLTGRSSSEIVCGIPGVVDLTDWVRFLASENRSNECIDKIILDHGDDEKLPKQIEDMLQTALRCTLPAAERPDMKTAFEDLLVIVQ